MTQEWYATLGHAKMHPHTKCGIPSSKNKEVILEPKSQGHSDRKRKQDNQPLQDAFTHQIWDSYLKYYKWYAPDIIILNMRSNVKFKVTVTRNWYTTLHHSKMHPQTKGQRALRDYFGPRWGQKMKIAFTSFFLLVFLDQTPKCKSSIFTVSMVTKMAAK